MTAPGNISKRYIMKQGVTDMENLSRHIGILENLTRMPSSSNGNPRFYAYAGVNFRTKVDSLCGYLIQNYDGKRVEVTVGTHYGFTTLDSIKLADDACTHCESAESFMDGLCVECYRDAIENEQHERSESLNSIFI